MGRIALYQKYRSRTFEEVVGQEYIVRSIRNALKEGKVGHAYLFCGPRGTGKTTMARLLAKAVNCEDQAHAPCEHCANCQAASDNNHPDIVEINAANETHVEDIRSLIERARLSPMMGRYKIYIIDEVHQLSSSAASALLKTLEEPPGHVIFILATTDPQKLLSTIISRCQRFDFTKVPVHQISEHLLRIASQEHIRLEKKAAEKLAELADGGMRDALSMLDQANAYALGDITEDKINEIYGLASTGEKLEFIQEIFAGNVEEILTRIKGYEHSGMDIKRLTGDLINALKDGMIYQAVQKENLLRTLNARQAQVIASLGTSRQLLSMTETLMEASERYKTAQSAVNVFEIACLKMMPEIPVKRTQPLPAEPVQPEPAETKPAEPVKQEIPEQIIPEEPVTEIIPEEKPEPPVPEEPQIPQPVKELPQILDMQVEDILSILVQCTKEEKAKDLVRLGNITNVLVMNKYIAALSQLELYASCPDALLMGNPAQAVVNTINETLFNKELYLYLKDNQLDKMIYAVTKENYDKAVAEYIQRRKTQTLPSAKNIQRYTIQENKEGEASRPEDQLIELFGADIVEVIEEDE